jgi:hypothetical protein
VKWQKTTIISSDQAKEPPPPKKAAVDGGSKPTPQVSFEGRASLFEGKKKTGDDSFEMGLVSDEETPKKSVGGEEIEERQGRGRRFRYGCR